MSTGLLRRFREMMKRKSSQPHLTGSSAAVANAEPETAGSSNQSKESSKVIAPPSSTSSNSKGKKELPTTATINQKTASASNFGQASGSNSNQHSHSSIDNMASDTHYQRHRISSIAASDFGMDALSGIHKVYNTHSPGNSQTDVAPANSLSASLKALSDSDEKHDSGLQSAIATPASSASGPPKDTNNAVRDSDPPDPSKRKRSLSCPAKISTMSPGEQINPLQRYPAQQPARPGQEESITQPSTHRSNTNNDITPNQRASLLPESSTRPNTSRSTSTPPPRGRRRRRYSGPLNCPCRTRRNYELLMLGYFRDRAAYTRAARREFMYNCGHAFAAGTMAFAWLYNHRRDIWASDEEEAAGFTPMYADRYVEEERWRDEKVAFREKGQLARENSAWHFWGGKEVSVKRAQRVLFGRGEFDFNKAPTVVVEQDVGPMGETL